MLSVIFNTSGFYGSYSLKKTAYLYSETQADQKHVICCRLWYLYGQNVSNVNQFIFMYSVFILISVKVLVFLLFFNIYILK